MREWDSKLRVARSMLLLFLLLSATFAVIGTATAQEPPEALCRVSDSGEKYGHAGSEVWGPTDLNSQISNKRLLVGTNEKGTLTLFKYPNPSYSDQIKHHAFDRREDYYGSDPNAGAFLGAIITKDDSTKELTWFREWGPLNTTDPEYGDKVNQTWMSEFSDTLVTKFSNDNLGLDVKITNVVPKDNDVFIRDVEVSERSGSPVQDVEIVSYENFNLVEDKDSLAPTQDWCSEEENGEDARYNSTIDGIVHENPDKYTDLSKGLINQEGAEFSISTAMAFDGPSTQYQVAGDDYRGDHPNDPYALLESGTYNLPGDNEFLSGQTSAAMTKDLDFSDGQGSARVYFAAAWDPTPNKNIGGRAADKIEQARTLGLQNEIQEKENWFRQYVEDAPMPEGAPENVTKVARRSLISIVQIWDDYTVNEHGFSGNLPAASTTQPPYGADWIRDGAYFDYLIDRFMSGTGQSEWVNQHNIWFMSLQQNKNGPCPQHCHNNMKYYNYADLIPQSSAVPRGGWAMNYYADGQPAGPIGGEIDETAYGAWTFWDHYAVTGNQSYLQRIYPAIELVGDRLTYECVEEDTGLQCPRPEDDHTESTQTIVGGASVYAGLDASTKAAAEMYQITGNITYAESALDYAERRDELAQASDKYYWNDTAEYYGERKGFPSPRVGMPAFMRPPDDDRMKKHMSSMWQNVNETFKGNKIQGQYEAKTVMGIGIAARETESPAASLGQIKTGLEWIADKHARANSSYIMGEAWVREDYADGEIDSVQGQPHTWEQSLFYLSSLIAYGNSTYNVNDKIGKDVYEEWNKHDASVTNFNVDGGLYTQGDTVSATATVANNATVSQEYHVKFEIEGPNGNTYTGETKDIGPIPSGDTQNVSLTWNVNSDTGSHDARVGVWKAEETGGDNTVDPVDIANEPTALANEQYRYVELSASNQSSAFDVVVTQGKLGEARTVTVSADDSDPGGPGSYQWVPFEKDNYENPIVVAKPASYKDSNVAHVRVRNVTSNGFYVQIEQWDYLQDDITHGTEDISYIAMEEGNWKVLNNGGDDIKVEAGVFTTGENWETVNFDQNFDQTPVVMTVVGSESGDGSYNDIYEVKQTRNRNVGTNSFETRLQYQESGENTGCGFGCGGIPAETVYYIAMEPGAGTNGPFDTNFDIDRTGNTVTDAWHTENFNLSITFANPPSFTADMQTFDGSDNAHLRYDSLTTGGVNMFVEEGEDADDETSHTDENVGYFAFDESNSHFIYGDISEALIGEIGKVEVNAVDMNTKDSGPYQKVNLVGKYDNLVVVAKPMTDNKDSDYAHVRTRNLQESSFEIQIEPWDYLQDGSPSGTYAPEEVSYIAMEAGSHDLPDFTDVEAGKVSTGQNWHEPNGGSGFSHSGFLYKPTVITTISDNESGDGSTNDIEEGKVTRNRNVDSNSFEVRLTYQEGGENIGCGFGCGGIPSEITSWIAFEGYSSNNIRTGENVGTKFEFGTNDNMVTDATDSQVFEQNFSSAPAVVADMQTRSGGDPSQLRLPFVNSNYYNTYVEEEKSGDSETSHGAAEDVGYIAFENQGGIYDEENEPPVAAVNHTPKEQNQTEPVELSSSDSYDTDGVITDYEWDLDGDGTTDKVTSNETISTTYPEGGSYLVELTVKDGKNGVDSTTESLYINWFPDILFNYTQAEWMNDPVEFNANQSDDRDGAIQEYRWDVDGDSTYENATQVPILNHTYTYPSNYESLYNYTVNLTIVDDDGATNSSEKTLSLKPGCHAAIGNYDTEDWSINLFEVQSAINWWQNSDDVPDCLKSQELAELQQSISYWQTGEDVR